MEGQRVSQSIYGYISTKDGWTNILTEELFGRTDGWSDGRSDGRTNILTVGLVGRTDGRTNILTEELVGRTDKRMVERTDGRTDRHTILRMVWWQMDEQKDR